jgi:hypothetical protein
VIRAERAVAKAFSKHKLPFGVGAVDLKLAQRNVRKHGLARKLVAVLKSLGMNAGEVDIAQRTFLKTNFGQLSFSLTEQLGAAATAKKQRGFVGALRHFATRIPPAGKPPT